MNRRILFAAGIAAVVMAVAGYGLYQLGMDRGMTMSSAAAMPDRGPAGKKPLYWHDPMVPGTRFDKPGKSPFMDMPLVPVYANDAVQNVVAINPRMQQNLGIRTAEVVTGSVSTTLTAVGNVAWNERDIALVQARANGFLERLTVRAPLDPVRKGQMLAQLYVPDWIAVQEDYLSASHMQGPGVDSLRGGARQRMRLAGMTQAQIHQVESTGKVQSRIALIAPIDGVISELSAREGMTVAAGTPLFRINGLSTVWVNAEVPEDAVARLAPGTPVEARVPALPGAVFKGKVGAILPEVNPATRTVKARIELANSGKRLMPGMFATLTFAPTAHRDVLLVPSEAVIRTGTRSMVIVEQGNGQFLPVEVETGAEANGRAEIRKGLQAGQKVVASGQFLIDSEASLRGTIARMGGTAAPVQAQAVVTHHGQGKVEHIGTDDITISHGPITTLQWPAMTMSFKLPSGGLPKNIVVGSAVSFELRVLDDGAYQIAAIAPTAAEPPPGEDSGARPQAGMHDGMMHGMHPSGHSGAA